MIYITLLQSYSSRCYRSGIHSHEIHH